MRGKVVLTLFLEPSTRTRVSFEQAGKMLSADVINISGSGSSAEKGESLLNTALTLQAMQADLIVIRSPHSGAPYFLARNLQRMGVVNAGDGRHAHPTQALLDLMTMRHHIGELEGKRVVIVGDVLHSRVARSDVFGLQALGASVVLCGPPTLIPLDLLRGGEGESLQGVSVEHDLDRAMEDADAVIALRIQQERQGAGMLPSMREYTRRCRKRERRAETPRSGTEFGRVVESRVGRSRAKVRQGEAAARCSCITGADERKGGGDRVVSLAHGPGLARSRAGWTNGVAVRMALL